jgi:hypothetical protein
MQSDLPRGIRIAVPVPKTCADTGRNNLMMAAKNATQISTRSELAVRIALPVQKTCADTDRHRLRNRHTQRGYVGKDPRGYFIIF